MDYLFYKRSKAETLVSKNVYEHMKKHNLIEEKSSHIKQQTKDPENFAIGAVIFLVSGGILFVSFYLLGQWQGRW